MAELPALKNFPKKTINYLKKLSRNNNKEWFEAHRDEYNSEFLEPALQLVVEMGEKLSAIAPGISAIPKIDKSIFRLHRDVRFSKNKSPYKTNLGILIWEGKEKLGSSGFYFHVEPKEFFLGTGMYVFSKEALKKFRDAASHPVFGKELDAAVKKVMRAGSYSVGGKNYKRVPKGYDPESPFAEYLLHDGFYMYYESRDQTELEKGDIVQYLFKVYKQMLPVHQWLVKYIK